MDRERMDLDTRNFETRRNNRFFVEDEQEELVASLSDQRWLAKRSESEDAF